jgi:hypothetical protein
LRHERRTGEDCKGGSGRKYSPAHCPVLHLKKARTLFEAHYNANRLSKFEMIAIIFEGSMAAAFIACSSPA